MVLIYNNLFLNGHPQGERESQLMRIPVLGSGENNVCVYN